MKNIEKFLQFNGTNVSVQIKNGEWFIAIKPICTALKIDYSRQAKDIRAHKIYSQLRADLPSVAADGKLRNMLCLPETLIYGWLANLNSDNEDLVQYQMECHKILHTYFKGAMMDRMLRLTEKNEALERINECKSKLMESSDYKEILMSQKKIKLIEKSLRMMDKDLVTGQNTLEL